MDSILNTIKDSLGLAEEYEYFDNQLIGYINTSLSILNQLGVGPEEGFVVHDKNDTWFDFVSDINKLEMIKSYIQLKVKLLFDAPLGSASIDSINRQINELEWRINVAVDPKRTT